MTDENARPAPDRADDTGVDDPSSTAEAATDSGEGQEAEILADTGSSEETEVEGSVDSVDTDEPVASEPEPEVEAAEPAAPVEEDDDVAEEIAEVTVDMPEVDVATEGDMADEVAATESDEVADEVDADAFTWHPEYAGKSSEEVRSGLAREIASDQRQHRLAMDGAEESESDALASVVSLERTWGPYDFEWAEQDPDALAGRITDFERERERRQEMITWSDYRDEPSGQAEVLEPGERPAELSTGIKATSLLLVVLLIFVILLAVWAL
jgi:hypothetical protein